MKLRFGQKNFECRDLLEDMIGYGVIVRKNIYLQNWLLRVLSILGVRS